MINIKIDKDGVFHTASEACLDDKVERFQAELKDWALYKDMAKTDPRFSDVAYQEFQHAVLMLSEVLVTLHNTATPEELNTLNALLHPNTDTV